MTNAKLLLFTRKDATAIVQRWLDSRNADPLAFERLVIDDKLTLEKDLFWGIYYRDALQAASASPGLAIVDKQTGRLYTTVGSSWYNWIKEFEQYKTTGNSEIDWKRSEVIERSIDVRMLPGRNYASVKAAIKHEEREQKLKELLRIIHEEVKKQHASPAGNPEMVQRNKNEFSSQVEIRLLYSGTIEANDIISIGNAGPAKIYCTDFVGNYYDYVGALHELKRYGRVNGIKEKGDPWVEYLAFDLHRMSDTWINRICIPIE